MSCQCPEPYTKHTPSPLVSPTTTGATTTSLTGSSEPPCHPMRLNSRTPSRLSVCATSRVLLPLPRQPSRPKPYAILLRLSGRPLSSSTSCGSATSTTPSSPSYPILIPRPPPVRASNLGSPHATRLPTASVAKALGNSCADGPARAPPMPRIARAVLPPLGPSPVATAPFPHTIDPTQKPTFLQLTMPPRLHNAGPYQPLLQVVPRRGTHHAGSHSSCLQHTRKWRASAWFYANATTCPICIHHHYTRSHLVQHLSRPRPYAPPRYRITTHR